MFKPTPGAAGLTYRSASEASISLKLQELGIVSHDVLYPLSFTDKAGEEFRAKADFRCPFTGMYFESKNGYMNGLQTVANADRAQARFEESKAAGYINSRNENKKLLEASWSASVPKFKTVQDQLAEQGGCVTLIFDGKPDSETERRLDRAKVFWCVFGDEYFRKLMSFRTLAKHGFRATFDIKGHLFESYGGAEAR